MSTIAWGGTAPPQGKKTPIFNSQYRGFLRALGDPVGVFVHWASGRTLPCLKGGCRHCSAGEPARWAGYVGALLWKPGGHGESGHWSPVLWYIPESNRDDLEPLPLRGYVFTSSRNPKGAAKPLKIVRTEKPRQEPECPNLDVRAALLRMWRFNPTVAGDPADPESDPFAVTPAEGGAP